MTKLILILALLLQTPPAAPTNLGATPTSATRISLTWADNSTNETGFQVWRCIGAGCTNFTQAGQVGANVRSYGNIGLTPGVTYCYKVRAYTSLGGAQGSLFSAYTGVACATPQ